MHIIEYRALILYPNDIQTFTIRRYVHMLDASGRENSVVTVLIADDLEEQRRLISSYVAQLGYTAETAADGQEAIVKTRLCNPDIILMDVFMPGTDGIEACRQLKADETTRHIPVIAVTGTDERNVRINCLEAGANDFMSKPIDSAELLMKIRNMIRLKEFEDSKIMNKLMTETFKAVETAKREWEDSLDCIDDIVILVDAENRILRANKMLTTLSQIAYSGLVGHKWEDILNKGGFTLNQDYSVSAEIFHASGKCFRYSFYAIASNRESSALVSVITLHDITEPKKITEELLQSREMLRAKNEELDAAILDLKMTQSQMLQQEKMASIGQIAAGVAHEINNPMGFIISNFHSLKKYSGRIVGFLNAQADALHKYAEACGNPDEMNKTEELRQQLKLDHILSDIDALITESLEGADRVKMIVQDLKSFSRVDEAEQKQADINLGIESTINIIWNEIKYKATIDKHYGVIPQTRCNPGQLNQVFMNLLLNASHAIENFGQITVKTWHEDNWIYISVSDNGCGMPEEIQNRIFEPFFTTKEIGQGTGLGLSIAYDIIKKHNGEIKVESKPGHGTTFTIAIPVQR
jgi:two-component system, NtrC family, sensor kinase